MPITNNTSGQSVATTQSVVSTDNITAWNSIVTVTSASATTQTLPQCVLTDIGKSIVVTNNGVGLVTIAAFLGDTLQNSRVLAQGEGITIMVTALNLARVISDTVAVPVITESLPIWVASTAVNASAERSTTIQGVLTGLSSKTSRTTTATFNTTEATNWNYLSQSSVPLFTASSLVLAGFQILDSGQTFQSNTTRVTGLTFDTTEQTNWTALSSSSTGTRISLSNFATNASIGTATATVDSATVIAFSQTTAGITVTIPSPTNVNVHKTITFENLTTATQPINIRGASGVTDTIVLGIGDVKEMSWNGNGWRATSPANVLSEFGFVTLTGQVFSTDIFVDSINGVFNLPSAGTWRLRYDLSTDGNGVTVTNSMVAITDSSNVVITGSEKSRGGASTIAEVLTAEVIVTTTSAATYKLRGRNGATGAGSMSILNTANYDSTLSWQKISGFVPVTGQSVDFLSAQGSGTSYGAGTQLNLTTLSGNIPQTTGIISLTAGKTYRLQGSVRSTSATATYQFRDITSNVLLGTPANNIDYANASTNTVSLIAEAIFTPSVNTTVRLENISVTRNIDPTTTWVTVVQLGSSAVGTTAINDQTTSGYFDMGTMRMQWGTTAASVTHGGIANLNQPFANTNYQIVLNVNNWNAFGWIGTKNINTFSVNIITSTGGANSGTVTWFAIGQKP